MLDWETRKIQIQSSPEIQNNFKNVSDPKLFFATPKQIEIQKFQHQTPSLGHTKMVKSAWRTLLVANEFVELMNQDVSLIYISRLKFMNIDYVLQNLKKILEVKYFSSSKQSNVYVIYRDEINIYIYLNRNIL